MESMEKYGKVWKWNVYGTYGKTDIGFKAESTEREKKNWASVVHGVASDRLWAPQIG